MLLLTYDPQHIVTFCAKHPIHWHESYRTHVLRGGAGDLQSPTPAAQVFFTQLRERAGQLMTQGEYADYCTRIHWTEWFATLTSWQQQCFRARIYRNFYPSFIDSLHVWALLGTRYTVNGSLVFDRCMIDTTQDVITKTDLLLYRGEECMRVALQSNSRAAWEAKHYKDQWRGQADPATIVLAMKVGKQHRGAGNKCWYHWPRDFSPVLRRVEQLGFCFGGTYV